MIRHIVIAAWRNMMANRLISAIAILGLAAGIALAVLVGVILRNQLSFDHFIPGHERIYMVANTDYHPVKILCLCETMGNDDAVALMAQIPEIESSTRLYLTGALPFDPPTQLKRGDVTAMENIYWADPNFFDLLPLPALQGDPGRTLHRPDGVVLTRAMARKYFGRDDVVGQQISVNGHPMMVGAVLRDLPARGTELASGVFASSLAAFSGLLPAGIKPGSPEALARGTFSLAIVYMRLKSWASVPQVGKRVSSVMTARSEGITQHFGLVPLDRINLIEAVNPGIHERLIAVAAIGFLVLFIAAINFINLMTVVVARRNREVGVRKTCGAGRGALMLQFLGEAVLAAGMAAIIALALDEWLLPAANAFLGTGARLNYRADPVLALAILLAVVGLGLAAGFYPAFLLSAFRPGGVFKSATPASNNVRNALVSGQFAILTALAIAAIIFWQQHRFATREAIRVNSDQVLLLQSTAPPIPGRRGNFVTSMADTRACSLPLLAELRKLPGVKGAICSAAAFLKSGMGAGWYATPTMVANIGLVQTDPAIFSFYGVKPVAGNFVDAGSGTVLNLSAIRLLGFASAQAAIGQSWMHPKSLAHDNRAGGTLGTPGDIGNRVVAVVPDFDFKQANVPSVFGPHLPGGRERLIHVRLDGWHIPETLAAIDRLWAKTGQTGPIDRIFLDTYMEQQYLDLERQAQLLSMVGGLAILLACMGLMGIAVSTAERRTKEIGIRKAMGADNRQIVALLLWQFAQPVLWANVIAWPVAWWLMRRWLSGFAYHIDLHWWVFAAASAGALAIALLTVAGQALLTARQKPVLALRTE
jgi:putative ABC transport system permease protein